MQQHTLDGVTSVVGLVVDWDSCWRSSRGDDDSKFEVVARRFEPANIQLNIAIVWISYSPL